MSAPSVNAFANCKNFKAIDFPNESKIKTIEKNAFDSTNLERITIPKYVTSISKAFNRCFLLRKIEFDNDAELEVIDEYTFNGTSIRSLFIPSSVTELKGGWCSNMRQLTDVQIHPNNKNFIFYQNDFLLGKSSPTNDLYDVLLFARRDIETVIIPSFIKEISPYAFNECNHLNTIQFPKQSKLKKIGFSAFNYVNIESITIPAHVTIIDEYAFYGCENLRKIEFPTNSELKIIEKYAFHSTSLRSIVIPSQLIQIKKLAFFYCKDLRVIEINEYSPLQPLRKDVFEVCSEVIFMIPVKLKEKLVT